MTEQQQPAQWIQCDSCARHVRASDERCPFCERDSKAHHGSVVRPAAVVIAALAALAPIESNAETPYRMQRSAQSLLVQAYGAPAPAYGLAPVRPPSAINVQVQSVSFSEAGPTVSANRLAIMRSRTVAQSCADQVPATLPTNTIVQVRLRVDSGAGVPFIPQLTAQGNHPAVRALVTCLRANIARIAWTRDPNQVVNVRWSYRFVRNTRRTTSRDPLEAVP